MTDERLEGWLRSLLETPGLTSIRSLDEARRVLLDDALAGVEYVRRFDGPIVDVGSGGGSPGIPLGAALPDRQVTLLEARSGKCAFLREAAAEFAPAATAGSDGLGGGRAARRGSPVGVVRPARTVATWCGACEG